MFRKNLYMIDLSSFLIGSAFDISLLNYNKFLFLGLRINDTLCIHQCPVFSHVSPHVIYFNILSSMSVYLMSINKILPINHYLPLPSPSYLHFFPHPSVHSDPSPPLHSPTHAFHTPLSCPHHLLSLSLPGFRRGITHGTIFYILLFGRWDLMHCWVINFTARTEFHNEKILWK